MKNALIALATAATLLGGSAVSFAETYTLGDLVIDNPRARATPPGAPVSGGYMVIHNKGAEADRLIGGSAEFAGKVEIHEMKMDGDVMKMREIEGGLEIPPGGEVMLMPGGFHVMFMQMKRQLQEGQSEKVTLQFQNAGEIEMDFDILNAAEVKKQMEMNMNHGQMKMNAN